MPALIEAALVEAMARASIAPEVESHVRQIQGFRYAGCAMVRDCTMPADDDCLWKGDRDDVRTMMHELDKAKAAIRQRAALAAIRDAAGLGVDDMLHLARLHAAAANAYAMQSPAKTRQEHAAALLRTLAGGLHAG